MEKMRRHVVVGFLAHLQQKIEVSGSGGWHPKIIKTRHANMPKSTDI